MKNKNHKKKGFLGENLALSFFLKKGNYKLLEKNFYSPYGEIDLILEENKNKKITIVFVEVKLRMNEQYGNALEQLSSIQKKRILNGANFFLNQYTEFYELCRFDYISFFLKKKLGFESLYIPNAFHVDR